MPSFLTIEDCKVLATKRSISSHVHLYGGASTSSIWTVVIGEHDAFLLIWIAVHFSLSVAKMPLYSTGKASA